VTIASWTSTGTTAGEHHTFAFVAPSPAGLGIAAAVSFIVYDVLTAPCRIVLTTVRTHTLAGVAEKEQPLALAAPRPLLLHDISSFVRVDYCSISASFTANS
jgi:hypothetical protein